MKSLLNKTLLIFSLSFSLFASSPTEEGLFRNGDNADIKGSVISYKIKIISKKNIATSSDESGDPKDEITITNEKIEEIINYVKVVVIRKSETYFQYIFLFYSHPDFSKAHLIKVVPIANTNKLLTSKFSELTHLNIGLLQMLTLNRSNEIVSYLKVIDSTFKKNREVMNKDKYYLYARYKKYLQMIKENPDLKDTLENPRFPTDEVKIEKVKQIEAMPMYLKSTAISLQKQDSEFVWSLNLPNIQASFDGTHLFMRSLFIHSAEDIRINVENFVLYDGVHQLPSQYIISYGDKESMSVHFISFKEYPNSSVKFMERLEYYTKQLSKAQISQEQQPFTNILFRLK